MYSHTRFLLLFIVITRWIILSGLKMHNTKAHICDVDVNKQSYDVFKTVKPECDIRYEEKFNFYESDIKHEHLRDYLEAHTSEYLHKQLQFVETLAEFLQKHEGFYSVKILQKEGIILDFVAVRYIHRNDIFHITIFSGNLRSWINSPHCNPADDLITWNDDTLNRARLYFIYKELKSGQMTGAIIDSICPTLKYRSV